jgi:putative addiction module component (TIGR02574 family)
MSQSTEQLKAELSRLTPDERAELAQFLIHTLDQGEDADAETAWDEELARRAEEIVNGKVEGIPADQVFRELREKYS